MKKTHIKEGLADKAHAADVDHEVQMARAQLYNIAKNAIELHDLLKNITESEGLEGWVQSKITKAEDYIGTVHDHLSYQEKFEGNKPNMEMPVPGISIESKGSDPYKKQLFGKLEEKAKSKAQQKFMGMVHATQKGKKPASKEVAKVAKDMPKKAAKDYASTKHKGKPEHVKKK